MPREKGSRNFRTQLVREIGRSLGYDPAKSIINRALNPDTPIEMKHDCDKALLPFFHPKLANVEVKAEIESSVTLGIEPEAEKMVEKIICRHKA